MRAQTGRSTKVADVDSLLSQAREHTDLPRNASLPPGAENYRAGRHRFSMAHGVLTAGARIDATFGLLQGTGLLPVEA
jgi:hypothetical protein